jgi:hypothetical protein
MQEIFGLHSEGDLRGFVLPGSDLQRGDELGEAWCSQSAHTIDNDIPPLLSSPFSPTWSLDSVMIRVVVRRPESLGGDRIVGE